MIRAMAGNGFVDVVTRPAGAHSLSVPGLGTFAPGAGPAIGSDGTVYLGTLEGKVIALHADGSRFWNRQLPSGTQIIASPAVGADQSVYVVGVSPVVHDHSDGQNLNIYRAALYKFTAGGGAPVGNSTVFPDLRSSPAATSFGPRFTGAPSIWQFGADEAVMVPAGYPTLVGQDLHILAFAPGGGVMADALPARWNSGDVTGDWGEGPFGFTPTVIPPPAHPPMPGRWHTLRDHCRPPPKSDRGLHVLCGAVVYTGSRIHGAVSNPARAERPSIESNNAARLAHCGRHHRRRRVQRPERDDRVAIDRTT
jgi:hypothetical protein